MEYIPSMTAPIPSNSPVRHVIGQLIHKKNPSDLLLAKQLDSIGWDVQDEYLFIKMEYYFISSEFDAPLHHALQLEHLFPESIALKHGGGLYFLLNISRNPALAQYGFLPEFSAFIRESMYKCGLSTPIRGFDNLPYALEQAEFALRYGLAHQDTFWYFRFEDYYLEYMEEQLLEKLPARFVCHPGLFRLMEYDQKNETDLYRTLRIYLQYNDNTSEVARRLHVHRTTLLYRLKKIQEISGIALTDWKTRLHLMMSYLILGAE